MFIPVWVLVVSSLTLLAVLVAQQAMVKYYAYQADKWELEYLKLSKKVQNIYERNRLSV